MNRMLLSNMLLTTIAVISTASTLGKVNDTPVQVVARAKTGPTQGRVVVCGRELVKGSALTKSSQSETERAGFEPALQI